MPLLTLVDSFFIYLESENMALLPSKVIIAIDGFLSLLEQELKLNCFGDYNEIDHNTIRKFGLFKWKRA